MSFFKKLLFSLAAFFLTAHSISQNKFTISGYITDASNGEVLIGANVFIKEVMKGGATNLYGFYSITFEEGEYELASTFVSYDDFSKKIILDKDLRVNIELIPRAEIIKEFEVVGTAGENTKSTKMGTIEMDIAQIKTLPALLGEVDILKTIQLLPGVQGAGEGNAGFFVRGGGPDQNLILLDEAVVYNSSHLFGFFSVFNSDAIKNLKLIKGSMPANYGGRLASVVDVTMKDGNTREYEVDGGIGVIASRLTVQGPILKDKSSFIVSGRRTYIDVLAKPFINDTSPTKGSGYFFYDLNAKVNYKFSDKDRIFASGYFGRDVFTFINKDSDFNFKIPWGNATASLRWNHLFNDKLFMNATAIFSDYEFEFIGKQDQFEIRLFSGIRDWTGKVDFNYYPSVKHNIQFGGSFIKHRFTPSSVSARSDSTVFDTGEPERIWANEWGYLCLRRVCS